MQLFHYQKAYLYKSFACIDKNTSLGTQFPSCYTGFIRAIDTNSQIALHDSIFNCKADIRNPLSLLAHERSRFATCQWELLTPTDISIPLTHRLVLYALEAGECLFCVQISSVYNFLIFSAMINLCVNPTDFSLISPSLKYSNVGTELISYSSARDS